MDKEYYKPIIRKRFPYNFLGFTKKDFSPRKRDKIIRNLVDKIQKAEKPREFLVDYHNEYFSEDKSYALRANIKSRDEIIKGKIEYIERGEYPEIDEDCINVKIKFNSKDKEDEPSYKNLIKILESENFDFEF